MIDVIAQAMRLGVGSATGLSVAAPVLAGRAATRGVRIAVCLIVGTAALAVTPPPAAAQQETRILILNALDPYLPAYQIIDASMRDTLANNPTRRFVYFSEAIDAQRFDWKQYETAYLALLIKKYKGLRIDVVVAVTQVALDFVKDHGEELWPGAKDSVPHCPGQLARHPRAPRARNGHCYARRISAALSIWLGGCSLMRAAFSLSPGSRTLTKIAQTKLGRCCLRGRSRPRSSFSSGCRNLSWLSGSSERRRPPSSFISPNFATATGDPTRRVRFCVQSAQYRPRRYTPPSRVLLCFSIASWVGLWLPSRTVGALSPEWCSRWQRVRHRLRPSPPPPVTA